jgi:hypothetical protein
MHRQMLHFLIQVAALIAVAHAKPPTPARNLKTHPERASSFSRHKASAFRANALGPQMLLSQEPATWGILFLSPDVAGALSRRVKRPVGPFVVASVPGTTRSTQTSPPLPCSVLARHQSRLPPGPSRLLLGPHSRTMAFESRGRPRPRTGNHAGGHSPSQVSDGLLPTAHVARRCYPSGLTPYVSGSRPSIVSASLKAHDFWGQNVETPPYPSV